LTTTRLREVRTAALVAGARLAVLAVGVIAAPLLIAAPARAQAPFDPFGFQIQVPSGGLVVHENAGSAVITVTRSQAESLIGAQVRYVTDGDGYNPATNAPFSCDGTPCTATSDDFTSVKGELDFQPGQTSMSFSVAVADHGTDSVPKTVSVSLFGPSPIGLGTVSKVTLTILNDDPVTWPAAGNPLSLHGVRTGGNPLAGARFFVDPQSEAANAAKRFPALNVIASQPGTARYGTFSTGSPYVPTIGIAVSRYLARAAGEEPGTVPLLATYRLVHHVCGNGDSPADRHAYHNFIEDFAHGIGSYRAVLFLEMDSLITSPCLNAHGLTTRMNELRDAINIITADCPHLVVYLDAGAADAVPASATARMLKRAGVAKIQGFFLNSTHFDWSSKEIRYGEQISAMTSGKHFVVNTGENGQGPLVPRNRVTQGNEVLCNPAGRGLGPRPTTNTGYPNVDMFAWTSNPGESGGQCHDQPGYEVPGAPPTGEYWPSYALMLVRNASFTLHGPRRSGRRH
jgi:endoglucanase